MTPNNLAPILILSLLTLFSIPSRAQEDNLVVNPSFEEAIDFDHPSHGSAWTKCMRNDTPDYLEFSDRGEPNFYFREYIGGLLPVEGNACVGLFCYRIHPLRGIANIRECIQVALRSTLEKDTLYQISLYVALDPESNTAINSLDIGFSDGPVSWKKQKEVFELSRRVRIKRRYYDSISWMKLEKTYKARGNEAQLILGNFSTDQSTGKRKVAFESKMKEKWQLHELEKVAYYYVDMVSVKKASATGKEAPPETDSLQTTQVAKILPQPSDSGSIELNAVQPDSSITLDYIYFEFDSSDLLPESYPTLNLLYIQLEKHSGVKIVIEGHTDNLGTFEYNMQLSKERAESVLAYLVKKGLDPDRIQSEGYGYTRPLTENRTEESRRMNRRVAFRIRALD